MIASNDLFERMHHAASVFAISSASVAIAGGSCPDCSCPKRAPFQLSLHLPGEECQPGRARAGLDSVGALGRLPGCEGHLQERRLAAEAGSAGGGWERGSVWRDCEGGQGRLQVLGGVRRGTKRARGAGERKAAT